MRGKNLKPNDNSKDLLDNFDLWEELEDQAGEQISGGRIFSFLNQTGNTIDVQLLGGTAILVETPIPPTIGTQPQEVNVPGLSQIIVRFDEIPGAGINEVDYPMDYTEIGVFSLIQGSIVLAT